MPIYEYNCQECRQTFEEWQKGFEEREIPCPVCGGKSTRLISNSSFILKGSGWYVTDYSGRSASSSGDDSPAKPEAPETAKQDTGAAATEPSA